MDLNRCEIWFPTRQDSATFWDIGTDIPSLSQDKGTTGQAKKSCQGTGWAGTAKIRDRTGRDRQNPGRGTKRDRGAHSAERQ